MTNIAWQGTFARLRAATPLIHNITNHVVMNWTANVLLAAGASPAMVHAEDEVEEFVAISAALVINIGTLDPGFVSGMEKAAARARAGGISWVLDPVGVGATRYRMDVTRRLLAHAPSVIRGNAGEIMALAGAGAQQQRGVDSLAGSDAALDAARELARQTGAVIAVTGATDYVVAGDDVTAIWGGHPISQQVTGTGCAATALVGACLAVAPPQEAAVAALGAMKSAAEAAAAVSKGPGSFAVAFLDALAK